MGGNKHENKSNLDSRMTQTHSNFLKGVCNRPNNHMMKKKVVVHVTSSSMTRQANWCQIKHAAHNSTSRVIHDVNWNIWLDLIEAITSSFENACTIDQNKAFRYEGEDASSKKCPSIMLSLQLSNKRVLSLIKF